MGEPDAKTSKKDVSLGAWPETRDALFRLCEHYGHKRVKMLYFVVKAFEEISAVYDHELKLPVDVTALKDQLNFDRTKSLIVDARRPQSKRGSGADGGKNRKSVRSQAA